MNKNRKKLLKSSIFRRPNYQNIAFDFASLPIAFMMLVSASIAVAVLSEDAWSFWDCTTSRSIGHETYSTGIDNNKLVVSCVNKENEKTYVEGDGAILMDLSEANGRTWLRWSVEMDGSTPKRYIKGACTTTGRESQMCYKEQEGTDAAAYGALDTTQVYWRLNTIAKDADGDGRSSASPVELTMVGNEIPVSGNENKFIEAAANSDENGPLLDAIANTNGLENFELEIDGVTVRSTGRGWAERAGYTTHLEAGGEPDQIKSFTVRLKNGAKVISGRSDAPSGTAGGGGIFLGDGFTSDRQDTRLSVPLTVDISGSTVESWASTTAGQHPRGVLIDVHKLNSEVATLKLTDSTIRILHPSAPQSWTDERGKLKTSGRNSPGIRVSSVGGYGSVRVDTPLAIETYGVDSPGISVSFASQPDSLREATREIIEGGVSWENVVWWTYGGGNNNEEKLFGSDYSEGDEISATTGLTRANIAGVFRGEAPPEVSGGALDRFWAGSTNRQNYPLSRMQVGSPNLYAVRTQIANIIENTMTDAEFLAYKKAWTGRSNPAAMIRHRNGSAGAGIIYEIDKKSKITTYGPHAAGIVADFFADTTGSRATIRIDDGDDFGTDLAAAPDADKVEVDHDDDTDTPAITVFKTKIVVDEPITTVGERSHGIWVMGLNGPSPLDERRYLASTKRDVEITANANISATGKDAYAIVLLGDTGTNSKISLGENAAITGGVYLGKGTNSISGAGTLSGPIMGVAGGTLAELDLSGNTGDDNIILDSSLMVTGDVSLGGGDDTVTVRGTIGGELSLGDGDNTVILEQGTLSRVTRVKTFRKVSEHVATVESVDFSGSQLNVEEGELRVSGHLNLGSAGTVTVSDGAVLTFLATRGSDGELSSGRITAATVNFLSGSPNVRISNEDGSDLSGEDALTLLSRVLTAGTRVLSNAGDEDDVAREAIVQVVHSGSDRLIGNLGARTGSLEFDEGDDTVVLTRGDMVASVDLSSGTNMLTSNQEAALTSIASNSGAGDGTTIQLNAGRVTGGIAFGDGDDTLGWVAAVAVGGNVVLGDGTNVVNGGAIDSDRVMGGAGLDTVTLRSGSVRTMTGVESLTKEGTGTLRIGSMSNAEGLSGSTTLSGSTAAAGDGIAVNVNRGKLEVSGHLNLGSAGALTVRDGAILKFIVTGSGTATHGRITADAVYFLSSSPNVRISREDGSDLSDEDALTVLSRVLTAGTKVLSYAGAIAREASVRVVHSTSGRLIGRLETVPRTGSLEFDEGDDTVVLARGDMVASVDLSSGTNMLTSNQEAALTSIASNSGAGDGTTIQLNAGRVTGGITFGDGDDTLRWVAAVAVGGNVALGDGTNVVNGGMIDSDRVMGGAGLDTVTLRSGSVRTMTGVESFSKEGAGTLRIGSMSNAEGLSGSTTLSGSTAAAGDGIAVNVNRGKLVVSGHLNLGSAGTLTVRNGAILEFMVAGSGTATHGRITGNAVYFHSSSPNVRISSEDGSDLSDGDALTVLSRVLTVGTRVLSIVGDVAREASVRVVHSNSGRLIGRLESQVSGSRTGSLEFDEGDDTVVLARGDMVTSVDLSSGTNMLTSNQEAALTSIASNSGAGDGTTIQLNAGRVTGGITFGAGDDTLRWVAAVAVGGNVVLGGGTNVVNGGAIDSDRVMGGAGLDTVTLRSGSVRMMTGVESLTKEGTGTLRIGSMSNDEEIAVTVNRGKLEVSGHLNLGSAGTLTVKDGATLAFVVTGAAAQTPGTATHGRITAQRVVFESANPVVERIAEEADTRNADLAAATNDRLFIGGTSTEDDEGNDIVLVLGPTPAPPPVAAADDDDNTALYAAGAIAAIWWLMCETGAIGSMSDEEGGNSCFGKSQWNSTGAVQYTNTGMNSWASMQSDKGINPVQGLAFGTNARVGENGRIGFSAMPNASGTTSSLGGSLNHSSSISGGLYSMQGEWGRGTGYASVALTHANLTAGTRFENVISGGGMLGGEFEMKQSHLQLTAGTKLDAGGVWWTPTLGLYGGRVDQGGYSASNAVLLAKVPGYRQSYRGWKLGLRAESKERMSSTGGVKWHPGVSVDMYRTATSGPRSLTLSQTDRTGALHLSDRMLLGSLPNRIVALRAGGTIEIPHAGELRMDYVGMEMDGEIQHGALLKYQNRF